MIRFTCPSLWADCCSWLPTPEGLVVQVWDSHQSGNVATIVLGIADLGVLAGMCRAAQRVDLSWAQGVMSEGESTGVSEGGGK